MREKNCRTQIKYEGPQNLGEVVNIKDLLGVILALWAIPRVRFLHNFGEHSSPRIFSTPFSQSC